MWTYIQVQVKIFLEASNELVSQNFKLFFEKLRYSSQDTYLFAT